MGSEVFYRKWRPQTLAEVVGQEPITQTLRHAVESGKIAHAYLFCGPRGTGKTSTGRILAKAVNCPNQVGGEPCNACNICRSITEGRALDVIEIDAASNRGIDEIRSLREKVNYAPSLARYKVYIIDEVHMLTEAACNALLKTLEEPPAHIIFVLATTEAHKMIPTIVSRCQQFNFHRLSQTAIVDKLSLICQKEYIDIGFDSLRLIARSATGSLRDAENILQQLIAYHGNKIEFDQVQKALGSSGDSRVRQLAKHIVNRDMVGGLRVINSLTSDGIDLRQLNLELVEYLRGLLLAKSQCEEALDFTIEDLAEMESLVAGAELGYLLGAVKLFSGIDFRGNNYSSLPLELALVDCALSPATGQEQVATTKLSEGVEATETTKSPQSFPEAEIFAAVNNVEAPSAEISQDAEIPAVVNNVEAPSAQISQDAEILPTVNNVAAPSIEISQDIDYLRTRWREFIGSLRGEGSSGNLDAFLRSACEPMALENDTLLLGFYYSFHKEKIEDPKYRHLVEKKLKEVFGKPYKIQCTLVDHRREIPSQANTQSPLIKAALEMGAAIADKEF